MSKFPITSRLYRNLVERDLLIAAISRLLCIKWNLFSFTSSLCLIDLCARDGVVFVAEDFASGRGHLERFAHQHFKIAQELSHQPQSKSIGTLENAYFCFTTRLHRDE